MQRFLDALAAIADCVDVAAKTVSLADVVSGRASGRTKDTDITVYKSVGSAVQIRVIGVPSSGCREERPTRSRSPRLRASA